MYTLNKLREFIEHCDDREAIFREICLTASHLVPSANLLSLWIFDAERTKISNIIAYDVAERAFTLLPDLRAQDFPTYFEAIIENEVVIAPNARSNPMTECLNQDYFVPNDIHSLLDFVIHKDFRPAGVICCESKGKAVKWIDKDEDNLRKLSVLTSYFFEL